MQNRLRKESGFLLLEALIAVAILAFAIAGLATLQNKTLKMIHEAGGYSSSAVIFKDIQDRIELNAHNWKQYDGKTLGMVGGTDDKCRTKRPETTNIAEQDLNEIHENLCSFGRVLTTGMKQDKGEGGSFIIVNLELTNVSLAEGEQENKEKVSFRIGRGAE